MSETAGLTGLMSAGDTYTDSDGTTKTAKSPDFFVGDHRHADPNNGDIFGFDTGPAGVMRLWFEMTWLWPTYPGGPMARGNGSGALCTVGDLKNPPHIKYVHGNITSGTYGGSLPFRYVNPDTPILIGPSVVGCSANIREEMDQLYGRNQWTIHMQIKFAVCFWHVAVSSAGISLVDHQFGYAGRIAQSVPPGIFDIHPLVNKGFFVFWLTATGITPPTTDRLYLYHETKVATTLNPPHGTEVPRDGYVRVSATPYPFHTLESFSIRGTVKRASGILEEITKNVPITDEYGTTSWNWNLDDHSIADWLLDGGLGSIQSDVYVSAVSAYTGTKPINAGKPVSIQCETNECCAPTWAITDQDAETLGWGLSIDADGLITGFIPRDTEPGGVYGIEVTVTGPTQSTSAWVYVEVLEPLIYGTVWVGSALLTGGTVTALLEVGDLVYASTATGNYGTGHIYYADKSDLTSWTECGYSTSVPGICALAKITDGILVAMDQTGKIWVCLDGALWTQKSTVYESPDGGDMKTGNLIPINSSMVLWVAQHGALVTVPVTVIDVVADVVVSSADIGGGWGLVAYTNTAAYANGVALVCCKGNSTPPGVVKFTINETTGEITYVGKTLSFDGSDGYATVATRHGTFAVVNNKVLYESSDGVTWTAGTEEAPSGCNFLYCLSPRPPNTAFLATQSGGCNYRTVDSFAHEAMVLAVTGAACFANGTMIELLDGTLVMGDSGGTKNIWVSTE